MRITAIVEKGSDGKYSIYSGNEIDNHTFGGYGATVEIAKADFLKSIEEAKEMIKQEKGSASKDIDDASVVFKFDIESFFDYFDCLNVSKFAQYAGINESKMRQYKTGSAFAGEKTTKKILVAVKKLGGELSNASL